MGNNTSKIYNEQNDIIQKKLHGPNLVHKYSENHMNNIVSLNACQLQKEIIKDDHFSIVDVFKVYHQKKKDDNNAHRYFTDVLYEKPLKRAEHLQDLIDNGKIGKDYPLLGFVMSIKDCLKVKGTTSTSGFAINLGIVQEKQSLTIKLLIDKGALITCKGNIPQALFSFECDNNIFGCATNLYDEKRSPGGSSGGDVGLVATKCVNAAIGNDIGGSLRIPALFCGIVGYKPTYGRISNECEAGYFCNQSIKNKLPDFTEIIRPTIGPLTRSVDDAEQLMKVLIETAKFDPTIPPLPWRSVELPERIGLFMEFSQMEVAPSYKRALNIAADILRKNGVEVIEINLDQFFDDIIVYTGAEYFKDKTLVSIFQGKIPIKEPLIEEYKKLSTLSKLPRFLVRYLSKKYVNTRNGLYLRAVLKSYETNVQVLRDEISDLTNKFRQYLIDKGVNMLLAPGFATPAVLHGSSDHSSLQAIYTFMFNIFNFPAGAIPITKVAQDEQYYASKYDDEITKSLAQCVHNSVGLPIGIQVAGFSWMDEEVLNVMKIIEKEVNYL